MHSQQAAPAQTATRARIQIVLRCSWIDQIAPTLSTAISATVECLTVNQLVGRGISPVYARA